MPGDAVRRHSWQAFSAQRSLSMLLDRLLMRRLIWLLARRWRDRRNGLGASPISPLLRSALLFLETAHRCRACKNTQEKDGPWNRKRLKASNEVLTIHALHANSSTDKLQDAEMPRSSHVAVVHRTKAFTKSSAEQMRDLRRIRSNIRAECEKGLVVWFAGQASGRVGTLQTIQVGFGV